jgi:DNA-binding response OmpR family regulator
MYLEPRQGLSHHILVIEDDPLLNELFCQFLHSKDFITHSALNLTDALATFEISRSVDLILLDYHLGDGTGLEFLTLLKSITGETIPPVIMVSTHEDPLFLESCFTAGVADYVIKPVNLSLLALKVSTLIKSVSLQRLIKLQNVELEKFKRDAEREEEIAKITYEYLLRQNSRAISGIELWLKPSSSFSGDIAIAKLSPAGDLFLLLADATGHGLAAAITVMPVVSIFNAMVSKGFELSAVVTEMNDKLVRDTPQDRFVAAVIVQLENSRKKLHVWNGGMPTAYWINDGKITREFKSRHMALGILEKEKFDAHVETWEQVADGFFLACSDGLLEATNVYGESFSLERIIHIINSSPNDLIDEIKSALIAHTGSVSYSDDVSICTLFPRDIPPL